MPRNTKLFPRLHAPLLLRYVLWMLLCCSCCTYANTTIDQNKALAANPQWLALLHMQNNMLGNGYHSEVDDPDFFLSRRDDDAETELLATLKALRQPTADSSSAWCRFPARAKFLSAHMTLKNQAALQKPPELECPELEYWRSRFPGDEIVLVYPDPYLKNVASVFGHTFLRLDSADKQTHPILLSPTVSYYADIGSTDNTLTYIGKGLTGHFPGMIEVAPYFHKLRKYSDGEDRDIHEYKLTLSPQQTRDFVDHVWEVNNNSFNYFFLDENCSYRLISMLDTVAFPYNIRKKFTSHTMPIDTVKALRDNELIAKSTYIPSARKRFYEQLGLLSKKQQEQFISLSKGEIYYDHVNDFQVLALAENYSGLQIQSDPEKRTLHNLQVSKLIRRQYESGNISQATSSTLDAPDPMNSGHDMVRFQTGWLRDDGKDYALVGARLAYHDLHDPLPAYQRGVQLNALDAVLRIEEGGNNNDNNHISLESIRWFALQSYSISDEFFQEPSWGFQVARQHELINEKTSLVNIADGYRGLSYACGALLCHGEVIGGILTGSALDLGWTARVGVRAGLLYQQDDWSWSANISQQTYLAGESNHLNNISTEAGYRLARNTSLYGSYTHEDNGSANRDIINFSLRQFF